MLGAAIDPTGEHHLLCACLIVWDVDKCTGHELEAYIQSDRSFGEIAAYFEQWSRHWWMGFSSVAVSPHAGHVQYLPCATHFLHLKQVISMVECLISTSWGFWGKASRDFRRAIVERQESYRSKINRLNLSYVLPVSLLFQYSQSYWVRSSNFSDNLLYPVF